MNTQVRPHDMALPPPLGLELVDGERVVGWIRGRSFGFRGFGSEAEAAGAAWVAYRSVARSLAQRAGKRQIPIDVEPLTLMRRGDVDVILASNREIATLVSPGREGRTDASSFGFELEVPGPSDGLTLRSLAHMVYRTLRRSGVRWTMWRPDPVPAESRARAEAADALIQAPGADGRQDASTNTDGRAARKGLDNSRYNDYPSNKRKPCRNPSLTRGGIPMYNPNPDRRGMHTRIPVNASLPPPANLPSGSTFVARVLLISMAIVATLALIIAAPLEVTVPLGFVFLAGLFGTLVLSALERRRQRRRERRDRGSSGVSRSSGTTSHDPDSASRIPSGSGTLAAFSISLLGIAFLAPEQIGVIMAAIGVTGLFVLRVLAMFGGWAPRGGFRTAIAEPRSAYSQA